MNTQRLDRCCEYRAAAKLLFFTACVCASSVHADTGVTRIPIVDAPAGTAGLGFGRRIGTSPYVNVDNISSLDNDKNTDLVPLYLYEGKYFFSHGTEAGFHLFTNDDFSVDVLGRYRFDRLESDADEFFSTIDDRDQTVDAGFRAAWHNSWGTLSASWLGDTLNNHNGEERTVSYRKDWQTGRWTFSPFVSWVNQDEDLTNYYYGVTEQESREDLPAYRTDDADFPRAGINTSYQWSKHMLLFANVAFEGLDPTVYNSPLVEENQLTSAFVGLSYSFGSTAEENYVRREKDPDLAGEWSTRITGGYTTEETFNKVHRGFIKPSEKAETYLAGLTLGKLLQDGPKIDYWGRFSLNRRLENDLQDDFFEYVGYVMAMGTGYSPWSQREIFRYGFGFGFSYAERVPMVEQIVQEGRGRNTSHLLNYLEIQVDFPLRLVFGERASDKCYAGLTVVHRSGIFGSSDILGNVNGGSNVLAAHLECKR